MDGKMCAALSASSGCSNDVVGCALLCDGWRQVRLMHSQQLHSLQLAFEARLSILNEFWKSQMRHERAEHARTAPQAQLVAAVAARQPPTATATAATPAGKQHAPRTLVACPTSHVKR
jgi:hypothetical protein